jgi:hypothetical protein
MNSRRWQSRFASPFPESFEHFTITRGAARQGFDELPCLLARAWPDGTLALLNPAWKVLGYSDDELIGRSFCELIALERDVACAMLKSLLSSDALVEFSLRCKDQHEMGFHWNRQFDKFTDSMFVIGDPLAVTREAAPLCRAKLRH